MIPLLPISTLFPYTTLFRSSSDTSLATTNLSSPTVNPNDPKNKKGPMTIAAAGTYRTGKENSQGRFVVLGSSSWAAKDLKSTRLNSSHTVNSYAVFSLKENM